MITWLDCAVFYCLLVIGFSMVAFAVDRCTNAVKELHDFLKNRLTGTEIREIMCKSKRAD